MISKTNEYELTGIQWSQHSIPKDVEDPELYKACMGFEAYFARNLIKNMRGSMNIIGGEGTGSHIYQDWFDEAMANQMTCERGLGLAEMLYKQIIEKRGIDPKVLPSMQSPVDEAKKSSSLEKNVDPERAKLRRYDSIIERAASRHGLDPNLIRAVILQESGGNKLAVSQAGAKGLMQLMDSTTQDLKISNVFNPIENIEGGAAYLRQQLDEFEDLPLALAAYNAGPTVVKQHNGIPPYPETEEYVRKVIKSFERMKNSHSEAADTISPENQ